MRTGTCWKSVVVVSVVAVLPLAGFPARGAAGQAADAGVCPEAYRCLGLLQDGIVLIEAGRWEAASVLLKEAAAGLERRPSHARDLALAYVYLGVARLQVADADETVQWFAEAQMRDPTLQLDPAEFPRDVLALWAEARELGMLIVDSEPSGAEVAVDGVVRGRSPLGVGGLKPGEYRVTLAHAGHVGVNRMLTVVAGRTERLFVPLVPSAGAVEARAGGNALAGPSFGDAAVEQAPVNVFPIPDRFPAGTTKKSGRSWWRSLAGLLSVAGGVAMMVETAECRAGGGNLKRDRYGPTGPINAGIPVETLGGILAADAPGLLRRCTLEVFWNLQVPDDGAGGAYIRGHVLDYERVKSGAYDPALEYIGLHSISQEPLALGEPGPADRLVQDPSFSERVNQALLQSVGDAGSMNRVPKEYLIGGVAMVAAGTLLATLFSHVTVVDDLAVSVTPRGGMLASRSFGW